MKGNFQSVTKSGVRENVQKGGRFLSGMIMPNIAAFIAWGFFTSLFLENGWLPNETLATVIGPMLNYLLPIMIGYTGGRMVHGVRGGVVGAIATFGVIIGGSIPMFLGAMLVGPLGGLMIKKIDNALKPHIRTGFEMLINNFTAGILGVLFLILGVLLMGPVVQAVSNAFGSGVQAMVDAGLLPLTSIIIEPAKILFLNNAIQYGVLTPMGMEQAAELGKSIFFILEGNFGPGLGVLLACWLFGKGIAKESAPGSMIILVFGGIHELYFPYVLMKPVLLLSCIGGGMAGILTNQILNSGLVAAATPGSIFLYMTMAPKGDQWKVLMGILVATAVSFLISMLIYKLIPDREDVPTTADGPSVPRKKLLDTALADNSLKIVFACDAGMGSSAMGAATLTNKFNKAGLNYKVEHSSLEEVPRDADIVVTHASLAARAQDYTDGRVIAIKNFMNAPEYDMLVAELKEIKEKGGK